ncbi:hypothetical protein [Thioalkalivibrio sp. ALE19]|uniref:hypothetical protein n=1 Tax=Thioalkalivibrio sp. ALE19 TaxID=1266909 RepID=UPI0012DE24B3|nr:hypothetical protein [Thioalkalivibrio sp. ALE19]
MDNTQDQFDHSGSTLTLELTLTAKYDPNGVNPDHLYDNLHQMVRMAIEEGLLTDGTNAELNEWSSYVRKVAAD